MTDLATYLERLGLEQYLDAFIEEGFDTWGTLLDIQESDLQLLNVKLGHRRKLQRAIADYRGISYERFISSPAAQEGPSDPARLPEGSQGTASGKEGLPAPPTEAKRKYRRHPKPDENAPEKPPSAYVLFSNKVREEVKAENLSFTEIAKLVGDRWQKLEPAQKEPFELLAASLKEQYNMQLSTYKKTDSFGEYAQYLSDFKAKHGPQTEPKRPKLDPQSSGGSASVASVEVPEVIPVPTGHGRVGSISSISAASLTSAMASPPAISLATPTVPLSNIASAGVNTRGLPSLPRPHSPPLHQYGRERRLMGQMSSQSSTSDDSGQVYDSLSRTATLSLSTPPTGTPPLTSHMLNSVRPDQSGLGEGFPWPSRSQPLHQPGSITPSGPSPLSSGITLPSPTFSSEPWRERAMDWTRQIPPMPPTSGAPQAQAQALPLPPLLGHDRMADTVTRTLPPLRQNPSSGLPPTTYPSVSSTMQLSRQTSTDTERIYSQSSEDGLRHLDRTENEAASTLAGLATRPGQDAHLPRSRGYNRSRPA